MDYLTKRREIYSILPQIKLILAHMGFLGLTEVFSFLSPKARNRFPVVDLLVNIRYLMDGFSINFSYY
ncbi:hypothetical protein B7P33_09935 [Sediminicola luteus]|uniref:Uncharacterized protein n=1 Tax=Sediminicola luteus TaxID=319238 RepID=A0A2A4G6J4_9FLAO|nr:hypothetical protein B7P33_09935 [Sediminicola luteus]